MDEFTEKDNVMRTPPSDDTSTMEYYNKILDVAIKLFYVPTDKLAMRELYEIYMECKCYPNAARIINANVLYEDKLQAEQKKIVAQHLGILHVEEWKVDDDYKVVPDDLYDRNCWWGARGRCLKLIASRYDSWYLWVALSDLYSLCEENIMAWWSLITAIVNSPNLQDHLLCAESLGMLKKVDPPCYWSDVIPNLPDIPVEQLVSYTPKQRVEYISQAVGDKLGFTIPTEPISVYNCI